MNRSTLFVLFAAIAIAAVSARPFAASWNDASRLATVESLVDRRTWAIDDSIFVKVPANPEAAPYPPSQPGLLKTGTLDKMFIKGHFYSDKSPLPPLFMAAAYKILQLLTGLTASSSPGAFCYWMTLLSSGLAYVIAVFCIDRIAINTGLSTRARLLITGGFALATIALPYAEHVNNHILLLGICSPLMLLLSLPGNPSALRLIAVGSLIGAGYTIDLGIGPVLVLCTAGFVALQTRSLFKTIIVLAASFPWFAFHHVLNYQIGGGFFPASSNPTNFVYPESAFNASNLTGGWMHPNIWKFLVYALDMLFGKKGFLGHDPALFLLLIGAAVLARARLREHRQILFALAFSIGSWLLYSATSNNYAGQCCSIRWFVPLLAPGYYLLAVLLRFDPRYQRDLTVLTAGGLVLGALMWWKGPWMEHMVPGYWFIVVPTLLAWLAVHCTRVRSVSPQPALEPHG